MPAGKIKIYKRVQTIEGGRRIEKDPELYYEPWCEISDLYGSELYEALDIRLENTIIFTVRHCKKIEDMKQHLKDYYIVYKDDVYDIYASDYRANSRQYVVLKANRRD